MHSVLVASLALAAFVGAAPADLGFTVQQVQTGKMKLRHGAKSMMDTYHKYKKTVPAHILAAANQSGTVVTTPQKYDAEYLCPVAIGSVPTNLLLDFDTGSSDLWVFSSEMPATQSKGHSLYTPGSSSSAKVLAGETWKIAYGDGSGASGNIYADKVVIGGVTATSQAVECATSVSTSFTQMRGDGLVGLAFDSINTAKPSKVQTFMGNVGPTLPNNLFAATLKAGKPGTYDFGTIIPTRYNGSITYVPVNNTLGFWEFNATGYSVGSTNYNTALPYVIADTGTTLIYLSDAVVNNYYSKVKGAEYVRAAGGVIFPCTSTLPTLSINIAGTQHTVPGSYLNYAPVNTNYCFGGLQSSDGIGFNILGDIFLKSQYVVFDIGNKRIGFAPQAGI